MYNIVKLSLEAVSTHIFGMSLNVVFAKGNAHCVSTKHHVTHVSRQTRILLQPEKPNDSDNPLVG